MYTRAWVAGCGFVTYSTEDSARAAIDALSEKCILVRHALGTSVSLRLPRLPCCCTPPFHPFIKLVESVSPQGPASRARPHLLHPNAPAPLRALPHPDSSTPRDPARVALVAVCPPDPDVTSGPTPIYAPAWRPYGRPS